MRYSLTKMIILVSLTSFLFLVSTISSNFAKIPANNEVNEVISRADLPMLDSKQKKSDLSQQDTARGAVTVIKEVIKTSKGNILIWKASVDLNSPNTIFTIVSDQEINNKYGNTPGGFTRYAKSIHAALLTNTTYFDPNRTNWTKVSENKFLEGEVSKNWKDGTVIGLKYGNQPEMIDRKQGVEWENYWFALTSAPRLLEKGKFVDLDAYENMTCKETQQCSARTPQQRSAIGFSSKNKILYHIITDEKEGAITLKALPEIMHSIGCDEAMNLEGGNGVLMADSKRVYVDDARDNQELVRAPVIVVYDSVNPPRSERILDNWKKFQANKIKQR